MPTKVYRTAIYCRLSREDGDKVESNSIASQRAICEDYIARHEDLELVCEPFIDDGYSGVSFNRPNFKKLEAAIKKGAIDCIVVKDEYEIIGLNLKSQLNQGFRGLVLFLLTLKIADKAIHRRQYEQNEYLSAKRGAASLCSARTCHTLPTYILDRRSTGLSTGVDLYRCPLRYSTHVPLARAA